MKVFWVLFAITIIEQVYQCAVFKTDIGVKSNCRKGAKIPTCFDFIGFGGRTGCVSLTAGIFINYEQSKYQPYSNNTFHADSRLSEKWIKTKLIFLPKFLLVFFY